MENYWIDLMEDYCLRGLLVPLIPRAECFHSLAYTNNTGSGGWEKFSHRAKGSGAATRSGVAGREASGRSGAYGGDSDEAGMEDQRGSNLPLFLAGACATLRAAR